MDYKKPLFTSSEKIVDLKLDIGVEESSGLRPTEITAVLPTYNRGTQKYRAVLSNILQKMGRLVDKGVIDELLIIDGSTKEGKMDERFLREILDIFLEYCGTFQKEIEFVQSLPSGKQRAKQGRYEFSCSILHQRDEFISSILEEQDIFDEFSSVKEEDIKSGKGAALWLSVPASRGDVLTILDSDIQTFEEFYVTDLAYPILKGAKDREGYTSEVLFTKASYLRQHDKGDRYGLGGRLARLAVVPLFDLLSEKLGRDDFRSIGYPLSGEAGFHREALNNIQFSNGYDIELSILFQFLNDYGLERMKQPSFGFYQHLPGSESHVEKMLGGLSNAIFYWLKDYKICKKSKERDIRELVEECLGDYEDRALEYLENYRELGEKYRTQVTYKEDDVEEDKERIKKYSEIIWSDLEEKNITDPALLPKWGNIKSHLNQRPGYSYEGLKRALKTRVNKFTTNLVSEL
ncbi:MAG: hypothetical protein V5A88_06350 [Candidatus Thermoplasmatota archaeon]